MTANTSRFVPGAAWSRAVGLLASLSLPSPLLRGLIASYSKLLRVSKGEVAEPPGGYRRFNEFFMRRLRSGARPVDEAKEALVAPCDGVVLAAGPLEGGRFRVKGATYSLEELVDRAGWWRGRTDGGFLVIYLSPADYHRVHSPCDGTVREIWRLGGSCWPVNRLGQLLAPWAIVRNERVIFELVSDQELVAVAMVGALAVSAIEVSLPGVGALPVSSFTGSIPLGRGQELGVFNLGSTVVLLWTGSAGFDVRPGERVLVGQRVATRKVR